MTYRDAHRDDLPAIDRLFREVFCETFAHLYGAEDLAAFLDQFTPDAWAEEFDDPRYGFHVAESGGEVVAFVKLGPSTLPVETNGRAIELRQLYVLKGHHGGGIAAALMDWAVAEAKRRGEEELYLTVFTENHRALRFYDRYGFEPVGLHDFMVGNHADEDIIMRKVL